MTVVTVLGAGGLGAAVALRLAESGMGVRLWNRTRQKAEDVAGRASGITVAESAGDAVEGADAVLTVLRDGDTVRQTIQPVAARLGHAVWVQASTVGPQAAAELRQLADAHRIAFLDAPVSGSTGPARAGKLVWLVSGADDVLDRARSVLDVLGSRILHVGATNQASALKLAVNAWMVAATIAMSDVLALCDAIGVDHAVFREVLESGPLGMPYAIGKGASMDRGDYAPGFPVELALKDITLAERAMGGGIQTLNGSRQRLERTVAAGRGRDDLAAVDAVHSSHNGDDEPKR